MAKIINVRNLLLLFGAAAIMAYITEAEEYVVGGAAGWIVPHQGASFYSASVANTTFKLNDILVFNFTTGAHDVVTLAKKNFDSCNVVEAIEKFDIGPARVTLNRTGEHFFACAVGPHCSLGQKLAINVTASSSSSPSGPTGAAAPISAVSVASFVLLLMAIMINVLF